MGENVASARRHLGSMVEGARYMDVLGANIYLAGHSTTDAGRGQKILAGR